SCTDSGAVAAGSTSPLIVSTLGGERRFRCVLPAPLVSECELSAGGTPPAVTEQIPVVPTPRPGSHRPSGRSLRVRPWPAEGYRAAARGRIYSGGGQDAPAPDPTRPSDARPPCTSNRAA